MLSPKRVKFRKMFKGRTKGLSSRGATVACSCSAASTASPTPPGGSPVADPAIDALGVGEEPVGHSCQAGDLAVGSRLPTRRDQHARHVVGAIAAGDPGQRVVGVLERADVVAHRRDVGEGRLGHDHAVALLCSNSEEPSSS